MVKSVGPARPPSHVSGWPGCEGCAFDETDGKACGVRQVSTYGAMNCPIPEGLLWTWAETPHTGRLPLPIFLQKLTRLFTNG